MLLLSILLTACSADLKKDEIISAEQFIENVNNEIIRISPEAEKAAWVRATYITPDTAYLATKAQEKSLAFSSRTNQQAKQYSIDELEGDVARAVHLIKIGSTMPAPSNTNKQSRLAELNTEMEGMYGSGKHCRTDAEGKKECRDLQQLSKIIAKSRDYTELLDAWQSWRTISVPMRPMYEEFVAIMNEGANEQGFSDTGELWKSGYDMSVNAFEQETERLWSQVKPLYEQLHCYVGSKLRSHYGSDKVMANEPIPAHLLGNMWAQQWGEIYDLLEPYPGVLNLDVTAGLENARHTPESIT